MSYESLLANAPAHDTPEFLEYLRKNNKVVWEDEWWLVIENAKYHHPTRLWYTAFVKDNILDQPTDLEGLENEFSHLEWKKKASKKQTVGRFHLHLYEET